MSNSHEEMLPTNHLYFQEEGKTLSSIYSEYLLAQMFSIFHQESNKRTKKHKGKTLFTIYPEIIKLFTVSLFAYSINCST